MERSFSAKPVTSRRARNVSEALKRILGASRATGGGEGLGSSHRNLCPECALKGFPGHKHDDLGCCWFHRTVRNASRTTRWR